MGSSVGARHLQPVADVVLHLVEAQRAQVVAHRDALAELAQRVIIQPVPQFGLSPTYCIAARIVVELVVSTGYTR